MDREKPAVEIDKDLFAAPANSFDAGAHDGPSARVAIAGCDEAGSELGAFDGAAGQAWRDGADYRFNFGQFGRGLLGSASALYSAGHELGPLHVVQERRRIYGAIQRRLQVIAVSGDEFADYPADKGDEDT